jgi:putative NADH-flavin reductase
MVITVFGASGRVGSLIVEELLDGGNSVTAFIHGDSKFKANKNLKIVQGDIYSIDDVERSLLGADAVISALGSWGTAKKDVLTEGMKNIIPLMEKNKIKRIVSLTGADALVHGDKVRLFDRITHFFLNIVAGKILIDGEQHVELLRKSMLDWTVVRSPVMNEKGSVEKFVLTIQKPMPWEAINRNSAAKSMVSLVGNADFIHQAPYIRRI